MKKESKLKTIIQENILFENFFGTKEELKDKSLRTGAKQLRNEIFGKNIISYLSNYGKKLRTLKELKMDFMNSGITKNEAEFKEILPELKDVELDYSTSSNYSCKLKIKELENSFKDKKYLVRKENYSISYDTSF